MLTKSKRGTPPTPLFTKEGGEAVTRTPSFSKEGEKAAALTPSLTKEVRRATPRTSSFTNFTKDVGRATTRTPSLSKEGAGGVEADLPTAQRAVQTPFGTFLLEATAAGVCRLQFPGKSSIPPQEELKIPREARRHLKAAEVALKKFFSRKPVPFQSLTFDLRALSPSERKVLHKLCSVGFGQTTSYKTLGKNAGFSRAARFVGNVMRKNPLPILIPCHRVLRSDGKLGGYSLGLDWKVRLLEFEKVNLNFQT